MNETLCGGCTWMEGIHIVNESMDGTRRTSMAVRDSIAMSWNRMCTHEIKQLASRLLLREISNVIRYSFCLMRILKAVWVIVGKFLWCFLLLDPPLSFTFLSLVTLFFSHHFFFHQDVWMVVSTSHRMLRFLTREAPCSTRFAQLQPLKKVALVIVRYRL